MEFRDLFSQYTKENYKDIAFVLDNKSLFPDIETGYTQVKIVYNNAYHALDLRFSGMGEFEQLFAEYVYPVLMKYRDFSIWKMSSARVIRVKVPCINEDVGFIADDCDEQMERVRTFVEMLSKIDVAKMYSTQRLKRERTFKTDAQIESETQMFIKDFSDSLIARHREIEDVGSDELGKKGIHNRLISMNKDIDGFIFAHQQFIDNNPNLICNQTVLELKETISKLLNTF